MFDLLAFPDIQPYQTGLVIAYAAHLIAVTALVARRGQPVWLGMICGFLPGVGLGLGLMLPTDKGADDRATSTSGPGPMTFGPVTLQTGLFLLFAAVPLVVRLFAPGYPIIDQNLGLYLCLFGGLLITLLLGLAALAPQIELIAQRAVLVLGLGFLALVLIERNALRFDMTAEQRYSLDPATRSVLEKLSARPDKLSITYYYSPRSLRPHRLSRLPEEIQEMLEEYRRVAPDNVRIQLVEVPQKQTRADDEEEGGFGIGGGFSTKSDDAKRAELEDMTEEEKARTELLELIRRRSIDQVEEERLEGTRRVKVSYYSSFYVSYGQQPGDRINNVTVTRDEERAGKRAVDQANYLLTDMVRRLVLATVESTQPFSIRRFSADGTRVQFLGDATWHAQGSNELKAEEKSWVLSKVDAAAQTVTVQAIDAGSEPRVIRQMPPVKHKVGFLSGHGMNPQYFEALRNELSGTERFEWEYVDLANGNQPVPDHIDVLVMGSTAQELPLREQYEIDQFMMRGGGVMAFYGLLDLNPGQPPMIPRSWDGPDRSWAAFLKRYGVQVGRDMIFDEQCLIFTRGDASTPAPAVHHITSYPPHPINSGISLSERQMDPDGTSTYLFMPTQINVAKESLPRDEKGEPLVIVADILLSSPRAWQHAVPAVFRRDPFNWTDPSRPDYSEAVRQMRHRARDEYGQFVTAASLEGLMRSGFKPDMIPPRMEEADVPPDFPGMNPFGGGDMDNDGLQGNSASGAAADNQPGQPVAPAQPPVQPLPPDGPQTGPGADLVQPGTDTPPTEDPLAADKAAHLAQSERPTRMVIFGTTMLYPLDLNFGNTHQYFINSLDWLAGNDDLLALKAKTSARRPIDPTLSDSTRDWFGWMVFLVVPLALVLVSLFLFVFGVQERWFLRARQQSSRSISGLPGTATATAAETAAAAKAVDREPGLMALVMGVCLLAALVVWAMNGGHPGLWLLGLLLALPLIARGSQILFGNQKQEG